LAVSSNYECRHCEEQRAEAIQIFIAFLDCFACARNDDGAGLPLSRPVLIAAMIN
jgi:hypothetical protein